MLELETGRGGIWTVAIDKHYKSGLPLPGEPAVTHSFPAHHILFQLTTDL